MAIERFSKINTGRYDQEVIQESVRRVLEQYTEDPFSDHAIYEDVELTSGRVNQLTHGLGRDCRGCIVLGADTLVLYRFITEYDGDFALYCPIEVTASGIVDVMVY